MFRQWSQKPYGDSIKPSHLLYDGGKLYVPVEQMKDFLDKYEQAWKRGEALYVVETRPKLFRFVMDLDISDDHYWTLEEIVEFTKWVQDIVREFFDPMLNHDIIIALSKMKMKGDNVHTGVHLIWPNIVVQSTQACVIRRGLVQKLANYPKKCKNLWEDVIDEVIYTRNGFRMIGSDKMSRDRIAEKRPLEYLCTVKNDKQLCMDCPDGLIHLTCLYTPRSVANTLIMPSWIEQDALAIAENRQAKKKLAEGVVCDDEQHQLIKQFIDSNLPTQYYDKLKEVKQYDDGNMLIKMKSRYCMNLGREHNSCGIYLVASIDGIYQKCLCPCEKLDGRKHGFCRDYRSQTFKFNRELMKKLFPEQFTQQLNDHLVSHSFQPDTIKLKVDIQKARVDKLLDQFDPTKKKVDKKKKKK